MINTESRSKFLDAALDAAYNAIVVVNGEGEITECNTSFSKVMGASKEELKSKHITEVIPHTGLPAVLKSRLPHLGARITLGGKTYLSNRTPIIDDGELLGAVAVLQDITTLSLCVPRGMP